MSLTGQGWNHQLMDVLARWRGDHRATLGGGPYILDTR
jgi:hypothetical protein